MSLQQNRYKIFLRALRVLRGLKTIFLPDNIKREKRGASLFWVNTYLTSNIFLIWLNDPACNS